MTDKTKSLIKNFFEGLLALFCCDGDDGDDQSFA